LRLQGATSGYNKTKPIAGNVQPNPAPATTVDMLFEDVPKTDSYSLSYLGSNGQETKIIESAQYSLLQDSSSS
jgi:hypothetical protein